MHSELKVRCERGAEVRDFLPTAEDGLTNTAVY